MKTLTRTREVPLNSWVHPSERNKCVMHERKSKWAKAKNLLQKRLPFIINIQIRINLFEKHVSNGKDTSIIQDWLVKTADLDVNCNVYICFGSWQLFSLLIELSFWLWEWAKFSFQYVRETSQVDHHCFNKRLSSMIMTMKRTHDSTMMIHDTKVTIW